MVKHAAEQLHFTVNGMRYAAQRWQNTDTKGALKPVLCLHGWLDNSESFARLAPMLEQCDVVALDMAGHGETSHRAAHARYDIYDDLEDIADLTTDFGWQQFNLLAHSRGAGIATLFASIFPERVHSLVSLDGIAPPPLAERNFIEQLRAHIEERAAMRNKLPKPYATLEQAVERRLQSTRLSVVDAKDMFVRDLVQNDEGYIWRHDRRLHGASAVRMSDEHIALMLSLLQTPTLVIGAEQGMLAERDWLKGTLENPHIKVSSHPG
ncbi:MAG: alpha/beta hydrolase, partial [Gammaproteobacteria bacterium]|nr:alpha/beta hydrolase [Gammaproteobacteria bacterium]